MSALIISQKIKNNLSLFQVAAYTDAKPKHSV